MDAFKAFLQSVTVLSLEDMALLDKMAENMHVGRKSCLLQPGQVCTTIYFVRRGQFRLYDLDSNGNQVNRRFTFEHQFAVDFQSFITQSPSRYYLQAMKDSEVTAIEYQELIKCYEQSKGWERLGRLLAERAYLQVNEKLELMQFHTPEERYGYILKTRPELLERVSLAHLSSYLGIRPESLSRLRKRMVRK